MNSSPLYLVLFSLLFAGCAVKYVPPPDNNAATMVFSNLGHSDGQVILFDNYLDCSGGRFLDAIPRGAERTVNIATGEPLSFAMFYSWIGPGSLGYTSSAIYSCKIIATFTPEVGGQYASVIQGDTKNCLLFAFKKQGDGREPVELIYRDMIQDFWSASSPQCTTAIKEPTLPAGSAAESSLDTRQDQSEVALVQTDPVVTAPKGPSISGTWSFKINEGNGFRLFDRPLPVINLEQDGDRISGSSPDGGYTISGTRNGDKINFYFIAPRQEGRGSWTISPSGNRLAGRWTTQGNGISGTWAMQKQLQLE